MRNYKNNFKRHRYRSNGDRNYKRNGNGKIISTEFTNGTDFKRKNPGKNNQNASRLIQKYNELAREALSNGDKILSENYLQHADHFSRISEEQINNKKSQANVENLNKPSETNIETPSNSENKQD